MSAVVIEYPDTWLNAMGMDAEQFSRDARLAAAMKLFEVGRLTSGQAAQFAGIPRRELLLSCHQWGVDSVSWDEDELRNEFETPVRSEQ